MKKTHKKYASICHILLVLCLIFSGCGNDNNVTPTPGPGTSTNSTEKGTRDNTPIVLAPVASGTTTHSCDVATIDTSNAAEGYIMAEYTGTVEKIKLQIKGDRKSVV